MDNDYTKSILLSCKVMTALYAPPEICYFKYMLGFLYKSSIHQQKEVNVKKEWNVMKKTHFLPQTTLISKLQWQILFRLLPCQLRQWARDIQTQLSTSGKQDYFWKYPAFFKDDQIHVKTFENWNILSSLQRKKTQTRGVHYKGLHKSMFTTDSCGYVETGNSYSLFYF